MDDELDQLKPVGLPANKERWNVEDLNAYITALKAEIGIVEQMRFVLLVGLLVQHGWSYSVNNSDVHGCCAGVY